MWEKLAEKLNDDLIISIPTKDIVYYTKLNDKNLRDKMFKMVNEMWDKNQNETPYLIFCKDIFIYSKKDKNVSVSTEYKL